MSQRLWASSLSLIVAMCAAQVAQGQLITAAQWRNSTNTGTPQIVSEGLHVGDPVFVDRINYNGRTTRFAVVPESLLGMEYVMLANGDRSTPNFQLDITLARAGTIYLFIDNRVGDENNDNPPTLGGSIMQWVIDLGFTTTYEQVGIDEKNQGNIDRWSTVYKLDVPAGTTTLYEQNDGASRNMYCVAAWGPSPTAYNPVPEDLAEDVPVNALLSWTPGADAQAHDVYLGINLDDVTNATRANPLGVLVATAQDANTFDPTGLLDFDGTYYWRVDEVAANGAITRGTVWRFEVEPEGYPIAGDLIVATASSFQAGSGPENTINGSGLDAQDGHSTVAKDMWQTESGAAEPVWIQYQFDKVYKLHQMLVWNYNGDLEFLVGFGLKDVTVQYSTDGASWTALGDFTFNQGTSTASYKANTTVDFEGVAARYVRLVVNSSWGVMGRHGLSEVRFLYVPTWAREPSPAAGETDVDADVTLTWRAGRDAASHNVYLSTDEQAVASGMALIDAVNENQCQVSGLILGTTYYWKVGEVNTAEPVASWDSEVWSFTTRDFHVVDDFESYTDGSPNRVFQTWRDGLGFSPDEFFPMGDDGNGTGSAVGYNPEAGNIMERVVYHGGWQSAPFAYDNQVVSLSEATRTFEDAQDWTRGGARFLALYFYGQTTNTVGQLYVKINDFKVPYTGAAEDLMKPFWIPWSIDLTTLNTDLTKVKTLTIGVDNGGSGLLLVDDIWLYRVAPAMATEEVWIEAEAADSIVMPMRRYSDRPDAWGGRYIATFGDSSSSEPPDNGVASYTVYLDAGTYRIIGRVIDPTGNDDSFWVNLAGATTNTLNHVSGWVQWGLVDLGDTWHNVPVRSADDADQTVLFTVATGFYNLQIAFREDGALLDAWMITKQLQ
jgi:hypothetical protein